MSTTFQFEGHEFATLAEFSRAYPAYRTYARAVRGGVDTIADLERHIARKISVGRRASINAARRNAQLHDPILPARRARA